MTRPARAVWRDNIQSPVNAGREAPEGHTMTEYLIAAILVAAMVTILVYLWKREHS